MGIALFNKTKEASRQIKRDSQAKNHWPKLVVRIKKRPNVIRVICYVSILYYICVRAIVITIKNTSIAQLNDPTNMYRPKTMQWRCTTL